MADIGCGIIYQFLQNVERIIPKSHYKMFSIFYNVELASIT